MGWTRNYVSIYLSLLLTIPLLLFSQSEGTVKWTFSTKGTVGAPAIDTDGTLYFSSGDNLLYALNPDGSLKWVYETENGISTPSIGPNGTLYCISLSKLLALDPSGREKWTFTTSSGIFAMPAIDLDGTIYVGSADSTMYYGEDLINSKLYAIDSTGVLKWTFNTGSDYVFNSSPIIGFDGTIYTRYEDNILYALNQQGAIQWRTKLYGSINSRSESPAIGSDGTIYIGTLEALHAINPNGTMKWKMYKDIYKSSSPVVNIDGSLYISAGYTLSAFDCFGIKKWSVNLNHYISSPPIIGSDGMLYVSAGDTLFTINPDGIKHCTFVTDGELSSPTLASDGTLYIGSSDNNLYAIQTGSMGLVESSWPKLGSNLMNNNSCQNSNCPIAIVLEDTLYTLPGAVETLDGSLSYDPDSDALQYSWHCIEKCPESVVTIFDSSSAVTQVTCSQPGTYKFSLTVTDNEDGISSHIVYLHYGIKWMRADVSSTCAPIADDGTIYVNSDTSLIALNPDGTEKWYFTTGQWIKSIPAVGPNGTVYIIFSDGLHALNDEDGTEQWSYWVYDENYSTPSIGPGGTIFVRGPNKDQLSSINPDGSLKWIFKATTSGDFTTSPSIGPDGTIYIGGRSNGGYNGDIYAINPDGTTKWIIPSEYCCTSFAPVITADGTLYIGNSDTFWALNPDGSFKWSYYNEFGELFQPPVIGTGGTLYIPSNHGTLHALNKDGSLQWEYDVEGPINNPAIGADGTIYFGSTDKNLYALNPDGTKKWSLATQGSVQSPSLYSDGTLYVQSKNNKFYAIQTESMGLADTPWPKFRKDTKNSGNAFNPHCPIAKVVSDSLYGDLGSTIILDATPSYDPDGDELTYSWRCRDNHDLVTMSDTTQSSLQVSCKQTGIYKFFVTVKDNNCSSSQVVILHYGYWKYKLSPYECLSSPAIGNDGTIYIGSSDSSLYALNPDGSHLWSFTTDGRIYSSPAIGDDGTIYIGSNDKHLHAINPNGSQIWKFATEDVIHSSPAIAIDGTIYFGSNDHHLYAINPDGSQKWSFPTGDQIIAPPVIDYDGTIYIGSHDQKFYAINPNGTEIWHIDVNSTISHAAAIGSDGTIYFGTDHWNENQYAINPDGSIKYRYGRWGAGSAPTIGYDETVFWTNKESPGIVDGFIPNGELDYRFINNWSEIRSSPIIAVDSTLLLSFTNGSVVLSNPTQNAESSISVGASEVQNSGALTNNGTFYILGRNYLYAIQTNCHGLANSAWPKYQQNNKNQGRAARFEPSAVNLSNETPSHFSLQQNFPNPFNPITTIPYALAENCQVSIIIYNALGCEVCNLVNSKQAAGHYNVAWEGRNNQGIIVPTGMYFVQMKTEKFKTTRKVLFLR